MEKPKRRHVPRSTTESRPGEIARSKGRTLHSCRIGALPILNRLLQRMRLEEFLRSYLPRADRRCRIAPAMGVTLLLKNVLLSREPLYGIGEWAARSAPEALGFADSQRPSLNDDRLGRCLDRLFQCDVSSLVLALATHVVSEFQVDLDELHNDSTTITFHGAYADAEKEQQRGQRTRLAITWGSNKDHRPDLKQLLFILTVARDGAVPVYFQVANGNVADDQTHRATWDLLCRLTGRRDFLYVADCKLASTENMAYIHQRQGRFLTVLPRTRSEDRAFRDLLSQGRVQWRLIHDKRNDDGEIVDQYSVSEPATLSAEGYRLVWYHSTRKADDDARARHQQVERALSELAELRQKLSSPRTRYRHEAKVAEAVQGILQTRGVEQWIVPKITEQTEEKYRQDRRGRPSAQTLYVKETSTRFQLEYHIDTVRLAAETCGDGVFPLITNDGSLSGLAMLLAYKGQPSLEKRFSHLKTDFEVAPVYLKEASRIQALLCVYFLALLTESLLERELRRAMEREAIASLPLYPEGRKCRRPTTRRLIDLFDEVQCHTLQVGRRPPVVFTTQLSRLQHRLLRLLGMSKVYDA
ncbi:MAG: IS1634 family transposase [Acidobacteria bacterium]|nr:MAG: IS1634 family transposase [Acidobacteriota bacterium]